jgi:EmrB/QacA subfamily drug resistance transporter
MTSPVSRSLEPRPVALTAAIAVLSLGVFMSSLDLFIVNLAFPYIGHDYPGTSLGALSWVLNAYTIVFAAVMVPAGRWADLVGRRLMFTLGLAAFTVGSALCAVAPGVGPLVAARVIQAVGAGMMVPTSLSLLLAIVPVAGRAKAIGTWAAVGAMAAALGPVIGGLLVQASWRWVFWVNVPVGIVALLMVRRVLPESRDPLAEHRPDVIGATLVAVGVGAIALGLVEGPDWGWASVRVLGLYAAAVIAVAVVAMRATRHPSPVLEMSMLRVRSFSGAFGASTLYYAGFGAWLLNLVEFLTGPWHYSAIRAGLAIAPGPLCVLPFARLVAPRLAGRIGGAGRVAVLGCLVNAGSQTLWLLNLTGNPSYATRLLPVQVLGGIGVGLTIPSLLGAGTMSLPASRFGAGSGVLNMARQLGAVIGVAGLVAILATRTADPLDVFRYGAALAIGFFALAAVVSAVLIPRVTPAPVVLPELAPPAESAGSLEPAMVAAVDARGAA